MKTVGRRTAPRITLHPRAEALREFGAFNDSLHTLAQTRIVLPKGVFRLTHEEADRQMMEGIARGMAQKAQQPPTKNPAAFRRKYPALVWSNPEAPDDVWICQVLIHPGFDLMLDALIAFGLDQLETQWAILLREQDPGALRARKITEDLLQNARDAHIRIRAST